MAKFVTKATGILLAVVMAVSGFVTTVGAATNDSSPDTAQIESTDMSLDNAKNNVEEYFSNDEWKDKFPDGLFVVEYSSYQVTEGGEDPDNPGDFYLGIVIHRLGGNASAATVNYSLTFYSGDAEMYPNSIGTVEFEPQAETATAKIRIKNDDKRNGEQILIFMLTSASTGEISPSYSAGIKIVDDEPFVESAITVSTEKSVTDKSDGNVSLLIKRSENSVDYCTFRLKTQDGTAKAGIDYETVDQLVVFGPNQTEQTVIVPLIQSKDKFTEKKSFSVTMEDFKACYPVSDKTLRLDITNNIDNGKSAITMVDDMSADLDKDDDTALTDSANSVVNKNDTLDRTQLLKSVIGIANGTSSGVMPKTSVLTGSAYWLSAVEITADEFEQLYSTGEKWVANTEYSDGNEDVLIGSKDSFNLNYFSSVTGSFANKRFGINGSPNTAFGYLAGTADSNYSNVFSDLKNNGDIKTTIYSGSDRAKKKMQSHGLYILLNENNKNIDTVTESANLNLKDSSGNPLPDSAGIDGADSKLFFMLYDDEEWDDHHFDLGGAKLVRAVVPFSVFDTGDNDFSVNINSASISESTVSFVQDNIKWTIAVDVAKGGGVGQTGTGSTDAEKYGFYVGSNLRITYDMSGADTSINRADPQYLFIADEDGNIHNSAKVTIDDTTYFSIPFETLMSNNKNTLMNSYYMTDEEAEAHINNTLDANESINQFFSKKLRFKVGFALRQEIKVNFSNLPYLSMAKTDETEAQHKERVYNALSSVVTFYSETGVFTPSYEVNLSQNALIYDSTEFDYIVVDPKQVVGDGGSEMSCKATSNLYDKDYELFETAQEIPYEICSQIDESAVFTVFSGDTDYLLPQINLDMTAVSEKTDSGFDLQYTANPLDDYIPFEALYNDTASSNPDYTYYTMKFTISDIYISSNKGAEKDFNVNVIRQKTDGLESKTLFSFTFTGGVHYSESQVINPTYINSEIFKDDFTPYITLLDDSKGYEYIMYIPSYYSYQDTASDQLSEHVFQGGDGVRIEIESPDTEASDTKEIITALDVNSTPYVCEKLISIISEADDVTAESAYFEMQKSYYTLNNENTYIGTTGAKLDTTKAVGLLAKTFGGKGYNKTSKVLGHLGGSGFTVKAMTNQILIIGKLQYSTLPKTDDDDDADDKVGADDIIQKKPGVDGDIGNEPGKSGASVGLGKSKDNFAAFGGVEVRVQLDYNTVTHSYNFSKFTAGLSGGFSYAKSIPFAFPMLYFTFSIGVSAYCSYNMQNVLDYVDEYGVRHYKLLYYGGISITPAVALSVGISVGIPHVASVEVSASAELVVAINIDQQVYSSAQKEVDINSKSPASNNFCSLSFDGEWNTFTTEDPKDSLYMKDGYYTGSYNNSLCQG